MEELFCVDGLVVHEGWSVGSCCLGVLGLLVSSIAWGFYVDMDRIIEGGVLGMCALQRA